MNDSLRARLSHIVEPGLTNDGLYRIASGVLVAAVLASVFAHLVVTLPDLDPVAGTLARVVVEATAVLFSFELLLRFYVAPEHEPDPQRALWRARWGYLRSSLGIVDLLAAAPYWLVLSGVLGADLAGVISLVALCKLARYVPALRLLALVLRNESRPLLSAMLTLIVLLVLASGAMYLLEHERQPDLFSSIPHTLWWGIVTIATVGYGDMTPVTTAGRVLGGLVMLLGVAMFAVPAGILATGFANEIRRRDFLVTWRTVAQVPLFAGLDASRIAEIAQLLKPRIVPARHVVVRHGDPADAMFFIMSGEVEVELHPHPVRLRRGQFFGEIALLKDMTRTATVTTVTDCHLLALDVADFRRLLKTYPALEKSVMRIAETRLHELEHEESGSAHHRV